MEDSETIGSSRQLQYRLHLSSRAREIATKVCAGASAIVSSRQTPQHEQSRSTLTEITDTDEVEISDARGWHIAEDILLLKLLLECDELVIPWTVTK